MTWPEQKSFIDVPSEIKFKSFLLMAQKQENCPKKNLSVASFKPKFINLY